MMPVEPEESHPAETKPHNETKAQLEEELTAAKMQAEEYLNNWKRAQADFINFKRRAEQEKLDLSKYAGTNLLANLLPVLDDFERAYASMAEANRDWVAGVKLVESKLRGILESQGVRPIEAKGKPFDPSLHEGVMRGKGPEGIVVEEIRKGYMLHDRVLRPAQVAVGNGEE
jgi:molecular chaperone GrpE